MRYRGMQGKEEGNARSLAAPELLEAAARLIDRALNQLNVTETPCPTCRSRLFENREHAKLFDRFSDWPDRLRRTASDLRESPAVPEPSHGFVNARAEQLARRMRGEGV